MKFFALARPALAAAALIIGISALLASSLVVAQTKRILVVGDSWAGQALSTGAFQAALNNKGLSAFEAHSGAAAGGSTAADWATAPKLALITNELNTNPTIDIVHIWLGGNDFLGCNGCDIVLLLDQIAGNVQTVVDHIHSIRPQAQVVWASYDYSPGGPNGVEALAITRMIDQATLTDSFRVLNLYGVIDNVFGFAPNFNPGDRPLPGGYPNYIPLLGGEPTLGSDPLTYADPIHPTAAAYTALIEHGIDEFYMDSLIEVEGYSIPVLGVPAMLLLSFLMALIGHRPRS